VFTMGDSGTATVQLSLSPNALSGTLTFGTSPTTFKVSDKVMDVVLIFSMPLLAIAVGLIIAMFVLEKKSQREAEIVA
jgi:hypothetical protein